ncbi:Amidase signature domain containing protein [Tylopilus felleus]
MAFAFWRAVLNPKLPGDLSAHEVPDSAGFPDLYEAGIRELQHGLDKAAYLARIEEVNLNGAALHAVIETNPQVLAQAAALDAERKVKGSRRPLHGIPLLLKDNIATLHEEGSYALLGSEVAGDAPVAAKLREAGAIFLGKTNMSEWANFRGKVPNGFSGRGGQTLSPYYPNGDASGSSSGSGVAMAVGLAAASLGSETDGSIVSPSSKNNIAGINLPSGWSLVRKVTLNTVGPMCRSAADAALLLRFIAGKDEDDEATKEQLEVPDYTKALDKDALRGKRLGVPRKLINDDTLDVLRSLESLALTVEFKVGVEKYIEGLRNRPQNINNLADVIRFNNDWHTDQSQLYESEASKVDEEYYEAVKKDYQLGRTDGIDATLKKFALDAVAQPSSSTSFRIQGYPLVSGACTIPLGFLSDTTKPTPNPPTPLHDKAPGMPFGLCFATHVRLTRKAFSKAIPKAQLNDVISS